MNDNNLDDNDLVAALVSYLREQELRKNVIKHIDINIENKKINIEKIHDEIEIIKKMYENKLNYLEDVYGEDHSNDLYAKPNSNAPDSLTPEVASVLLKGKEDITNINFPLTLTEDEIIKLISLDLSNINQIPDSAWTETSRLYAIREAIKNEYILSADSPKFLRSNLDIVKQSLRLDYNSGIHVIWKSIDPKDIIAIEKYILENDFESFLYILGKLLKFVKS